MMVEKLLYGVIYSRFDEKIGPDAKIWVPSDLSLNVRNKVSLKSLNILSGETGNIPSTLAIIPFPSMNFKSLVKAFEIKDKSQRGGASDAALTLLFQDEDDSIYYKYLNNFENIFNTAIKKIKNIEETNSNIELIEKEVNNFHQNILIALKELQDAEITPEEKEAFVSDGKIDVEAKHFRFKVLVCGDPSVGKTSIILRYTDKAFKRTYIPTIGVNITEKVFRYKDAKIEFIIWDIAGQAKFQRMRRHFYKNCDGILLVFDLTQPTTFDSIPKWKKDIENYVDYELYGYVLANKKDLADRREIDENTAKKLAKELGLEYFETSALTGENVDQAFLKMAEVLYDHNQ